MKAEPPIPVALWEQIPPAAQAAVLALVLSHERFHQALGYRTPADVYGERNKTC